MFHRFAVSRAVVPLLFGCALLPFASTFVVPDQGQERDVTASGVPLRILPVGDSITYGYASSDGNGYRLDLLNSLTAGGSTVTYIGDVRSGNMTNNQNDGYPGYTISQIAAKSKSTLSQKPNVVLLHAGTNDLHLPNPPEPYSGAPQRLGAFLDQILGGVPNTTVLVAQIIHCTDANASQRITDFDSAVPGIVAERVSKGAKALVVNMSSIGVNGTNLIDGVHPNDIGYGLMAQYWLKGIQKAGRKNWITPPA